MSTLQTAPAAAPNVVHRALTKLFAGVGCQTEEQSIHQKHGNVICTLPGETSSTILVGGHFDFAEHGQGIVDDWSGTSLLPSLYQTLKDEWHHHTFRFVAFEAEEKGLVGSTKYVKFVNSEELEKMKAFINLECLGLTPPKV